MGKNTGLKAVAVIAILAVAVLAYQGGYFGQLGTPATGSVVNPNTNTNTNTGGGLGANDPVTVTVSNRDTYEAASITEASGVDATTWNKRADGGYTQISGGASSTYILTSADNGMVTVGFKSHAGGQGYIFSPEKTSVANPGKQVACAYLDPTLGGTKYWMCQYSTAGLKSQQLLSGTTPTLAINAKYWLTTTGSLSSPSDQTSIGTTANTVKTIEWTNTGTAGKALFVTHVQLKVNSTSVSKWNAGDSYVTLGGTPMPLTSATSVANTGSAIIYEWTFGYTNDKAKIVAFPLNQLAKDYMTTRLSLNLATSDVLTWTLQVDSLKELDAQQTALSDAVNMSA